MLPVPYFHVVFTVPSSLNPFALRNKEAFYSILFRAASETLHAFAADPKHLGAKIGFIAVLHTWGQNLLDHPHLHCVVPAGGISEDRTQWKKTPYGKFLFHGSLARFALDPTQFSALLDALHKTSWVVYAKAPFAGPEAVIKYLGRYTHRIAIANSRITSLTESHVSFRWKDYADENKEKTMTVTHAEFIRRFLLHVLPQGFVRIRYYGFLAQAAKGEKLALCLKLLGAKPREPLPEDIDKKAWARLLKELTGEDPRLCPLCHKGRLVPHREIMRPQRGAVSAVA